MPRRMALSDQTAKILIKEVKKRGCLWDPDDDRYNNRYHMARAWSEIGNLLHMPEDCLRVKWKNIRDIFMKEIRKYGPAIEDYTGKWKHFEALGFLHKTTTRGNLSNNEENSSEDKELPVTKQEYVDPDVEADEEGRNEEVEVYFSEHFEAQDPLPDKRIKLSTSDDDFDIMFLKSLAPYFKKLDPIRKLVVRSKMQDMLLNEIAAQSSTTSFQLKRS
ncbi:unnamed protein product [Arctia plantaginis]|uniref:Transcription factor Adf-1 n=1 Tax=Arctia plantaginis TaxID=874455 RepID=A0A8S1AZX9_ARCPL|nr:unnamed protein product [Arctia plantaginis]CAB3253011.1 unnamed protein product [Arctia plantaginis]